MAFGFSAEQRMLQDQVRALLASQSTPDDLRRTIEAGEAWDPRVWASLAELGVLGAGVPETYGGVGLDAIDVGVVARELGRAVAATPFHSSIGMVAEALMLAGSEAQKTAWLPKLASGETVGAFAWTEGPHAPGLQALGAEYADGRLNGTKWPVADAEVAHVCVVACRQQGRPALALVELDQPGVAISRLVGIDELRRYASISFDGVRAELLQAGDAATALQEVLDRAVVYAAFEQVGGAEAALEMARDFALQRNIFGRPLGSYQAVKHRLADVLVKIELATVNALYAARAIADGAADRGAAAAAARLSATQAYELAARENLQFHGGIGFTWEGDCHFHYRRARTLALNLGSAETWSDRLVAALDVDEAEVVDRTRPSRPAAPESEEDRTYRERVRAWLAEARPRHPGGASGVSPQELAARSKAWTKVKHAGGFSAISQAEDVGGAGGTRRQEAIFAEEEAAARLTLPMGGMGYPQAMAAIRKHGTPEQRRHWEAATYRGDVWWCQLFSEPGAGSDLAAVRTRAVRQGDKWIVNGQKVWTSGGHLADYGILLARTDPDLPKHQGLSFFIIDMRQPGVTTRPIRQINGQSEFTETFFVDAEVPDAWRLDDVGKGWAVAMSVLAQERTTTSSITEGGRRSSATSARNLIQLARAAPRERGTALDSSLVRSRIAQFHAEAQGIKNFTLRLQEELRSGGPSPLNIPVIKLTATNRIQQLQAFLMDLDEAGGIVQPPGDNRAPDRFFEYLTSASSRIAGGADEVLRNQLAERALGLPGDPRADKDVPFSQLPA